MHGCSYSEAMEFEERENRITCLGENFRHHRRRFGIKRADRRHYMYIIGKTGTGKLTLIANLARQDIAHSEGLALLDPHGDLVEQLVHCVPEERKSDLIYFNVADPACSLVFNPLEITQSASKPLVVSGLISIFKKIWPEFWAPRMEYILRNVLFSLLDVPGSTLLDIPPLFDDPDFRSYVVGRVRTPKSGASGCANTRSTRRTSAPKPSRRFRIKLASFWSIRSCDEL